MTDELTPRERVALAVWTPMTPTGGFAERVITAQEGVRWKARRMRRWVPIAAIGGLAAAAVALFLLLSIERAPDRVVDTNVHTAPTSVGVAPSSPLTSFDVRIVVGESVTIHDARGATPVQIAFAGRCADDAGSVEVDRDDRFRAPVIYAGHTAVILSIDTGAWAYRVRCARGDSDAGTGRIAVVRDAATRTLPPSINASIDTDGRTYTVSFQSRIPDVIVATTGTARRFELHLVKNESELIYAGHGKTIVVPGNALGEGDYEYFLVRDGVKDVKVSTLNIRFDDQSPQIYIESFPVPGSSKVDVRGAAFPGWVLSVNGVSLPLDKGRFAAALEAPSAGKSIVIRAQHPQRGLHFYVVAVPVAAKTVAKPGELRAIIRNAAGQIVHRSVMRIEPGARTVMPSPDGSYSVDLDPGVYKVAVSHGRDAAMVDVTIEADGVAIKNITLGASANAPHADAPTPSSTGHPGHGQLRVIVHDASNRPVLKTTMRIEPGGVQLDAARDGSYTVDLAPGQYRVTVTRGGNVTVLGAAIEPNGVTLRKVQLGDSAAR